MFSVVLTSSADAWALSRSMDHRKRIGGVGIAHWCFERPQAEVKFWSRLRSYGSWGTMRFPASGWKCVWKQQILLLNETRSGVESAFIAKLLNVSLVHHAASAFCLNQFIDLQLLHDCHWLSMISHILCLVSLQSNHHRREKFLDPNSWHSKQMARVLQEGIWHLCLQLLANPDWDNEAEVLSDYHLRISMSKLCGLHPSLPQKSWAELLTRSQLLPDTSREWLILQTKRWTIGVARPSEYELV